MDKNRQIAEEVIKAVGGKENINSVAHCMTRLRLVLKDYGIPSKEEIKGINGVLGVVEQGGQLQVIIGQTVPKVYEEALKLLPGMGGGTVDEDLGKGDIPKEKFSWKKLPSKMMASIIGCLTPILPVLIAAGLIKMIVAIIGPTMLNVAPESSDLYRLLYMVGEAGFYFFPVFVAWSGAKYFGCSPVIALLLGGLLIYPDFTAIVEAGEAFSVFGIPMRGATYSSTVLPMILTTWAASYVERFFKKITPAAISTMMIPLGTLLVMLPVSLCILGPAGAILGEYIGAFLIWLHTILGPVGVAIIGSLFLVIVATGMHLPLITTAIVSMTTLGFDDTILVGSIAGTYACIMIYLAYLIKAKTADERSLGVSVFVSQALGGVGEPGMFGVLFRYPKLVAIEMASTFIGTLYMGITNVKLYFAASSNFLAAVVFNGGDVTNFINGCIGCSIAAVLAFVLVMVLGYENNGSLTALKEKFGKKGGKA